MRQNEWKRAIEIHFLNLIETHALSRLFHISIRIHLFKSPPPFFAHFGSNQTILFISRDNLLR